MGTEIHYIDPSSQGPLHAIAYAGHQPRPVTEDWAQVTCRECLGHQPLTVETGPINAELRGGRPPHIIKTEHIQFMLANASKIAYQVNRHDETEVHQVTGKHAIDLLEKAAADAEHAAAELRAERLSLMGYSQTDFTL